MKLRLQLFCLLAALPLIASDDQSNRLTCFCSGGGPDCKDGFCSVDKDGACVIVAADTTLAGKTEVSGTYQTCLPKAESCKEGKVSFTVNQTVYWRSNTKCCYTDKCNEDVKVQPADSTLGTRKCPSCFGTNSSTCKPVDQTCAESEIHCITITGFVITDKDLLTTTTSPATKTTTKESPETKKDTSPTTKTTAKEPHTTKKDTSPTTKTTTKESSETKKDSSPTTKTKTKELPESKKDSSSMTKMAIKESLETKKENITFFARGCGTKEGIVGKGIPLNLQGDTFHFRSHGNPSLVPGSVALTILLPSLIGLLLDKFLY